MSITNKIFIYLQIIFFTVFLTSCNTEKIAYVESTALYLGFNGTIEATKEYDQLTVPLKSKRDSLEFKLLNLQNHLESQDLSKEEKEIALRAFIAGRSQLDSLDYSYENLSEELEYKKLQNSWKVINEYIKMYGKESKYKIIHGVDGKGNIMYAKDELNITKEVLDYINQKYDEQ
jgi:outer membrane protein